MRGLRGWWSANALDSGSLSLATLSPCKAFWHHVGDAPPRCRNPPGRPEGGAKPCGGCGVSELDRGRMASVLSGGRKDRMSPSILKTRIKLAEGSLVPAEYEEQSVPREFT